MSKSRHEVMSPTNRVVRHDRRWKRKTRVQVGAYDPARPKRAARGAREPFCPVGRLGYRQTGRRGRRSQKSFQGVVLEFHQLATFSRVDSENHALLAMPSLPATVESHRVRVFIGELCSRERLHVFGHWHTEKTNQTRAGHNGERETYKPVSKPPGRGEQGASSVDCVTVWFFCLKTKVMTSPTLAV